MFPFGQRFRMFPSPSAEATMIFVPPISSPIKTAIIKPLDKTFFFAVGRFSILLQPMHDVHGPWEYQGTTKQCELYNEGASLFHSEFGVEGITSMRTLDATISKDHQLPVDLANPTWFHRGAWWVKRPMWNTTFGESHDVERLVHPTQFMQAERLRYALEADRRRKFHNSGTLPWQFNEPYPMAACTSAVDYYARPKPAYYSVARAYVPLLVSARFNTLAWQGSEPFEAEAWVCNSHEHCYQDLTLRMRLVGIDGVIYKERTTNVSFGANSSTRLTLLQERLAHIAGDVFFLDLQVLDPEGTLLAQNRYVFSRTANMTSLLACPSTTLSVSSLRSQANREDEHLLRLTNTGPVSAMFVSLEHDRPLNVPGYAYFDDSYFCLLPGESRLVTVKWNDVPVKEQRLEVSSCNTECLYLDSLSTAVH